MNYVVGLVFDKDLTRVLLVEKKRPEWQAGMLNGVGGKAEGGERRARDTMARECKEECGLDIPADVWRFFSEVIVPAEKVRVGFFTVLAENVYDARATGDEAIALHSIGDLPSLNVVPSLRYMIPLAVQTLTDKTSPYIIDFATVIGKKRPA